MGVRVFIPGRGMERKCRSHRRIAATPAARRYGRSTDLRTVVAARRPDIRASSETRLSQSRGRRSRRRGRRVGGSPEKGRSRANAWAPGERISSSRSQLPRSTISRKLTPTIRRLAALSSRGLGRSTTAADARWANWSGASFAGRSHRTFFNVALFMLCTTGRRSTVSALTPRRGRCARLFSTRRHHIDPPCPLTAPGRTPHDC